MPDESFATGQETASAASPESNGAAPDSSLPGSVRQVVLAAILVIGFVVYLGTLQFGFVYDDTAQILKNPRVQSWQYLGHYFSGAVWAQLGGLDYYRPIFLLWLLLNHTLFGVSATGWHAALVLLHLAATAMSYMVARRLLQNDAAALCCALLFGLHPAHVESVAWVSAAPDPLMAAFFFGSYWAFLRWRQDGGGKWLALSLGSYALAELSKEPGLMLIALLLGHVLLFPGEQRAVAAQSVWRRALKSISPFALVAILYMVVRAVVLPAIAEHKMDLSWTTVAMTWPWLLWFYIKKLIWAAPISAFYDAPYVDSLTSQQFWLPVLLLTAFAAALFLWWRTTRDRLVPLAVLWIVVPVLPTFDLVAFAPHDYAHDRYLYISAFGFCLLLVRLLWQLPDRFFRRWEPLRTRVVAILALAAVFAGITVQQSVYWANNLLLYSRGVEIAPKTAVKAANNLVPEMMRLGMYQEAMQKIQSVADQHPDDWGLQFNAASILLQLDHLPQAEAYLLKATRLAGDSKSVPWLYLGLVRMRQSMYAQAEEPLRKAAQIDPAEPRNRYALALDLKHIGKLAESRSLLQQLVKEFPDQQNYRSQLDDLENGPGPGSKSPPAQKPK